MKYFWSHSREIQSLVWAWVETEEAIVTDHFQLFHFAAHKTNAVLDNSSHNS